MPRPWAGLASERNLVRGWRIRRGICDSTPRVTPAPPARAPPTMGSSNACRRHLHCSTCNLAKREVFVRDYFTLCPARRAYSFRKIPKPHQKVPWENRRPHKPGAAPARRLYPAEHRRPRRRLRSPGERAAYRRRKPIIEPVLGPLKEQFGLRQFRRRGAANTARKPVVECRAVLQPSLALRKAGPNKASHEDRKCVYN